MNQLSQSATILDRLRRKTHQIWRRVRPAPDSPAGKEVQAANDALTLSTASMGLALAGALSLKPLLLLASAPLFVAVFAPSFAAAYRSLRTSRKIDTTTLDAVRIAVCVVMGYYFVGALNALLSAVSRKLLAQNEAALEQALTDLYSRQPALTWTFVDGVEVATALEEMPEDAVIGVAPGERLPAAGVVLYGSALVDQQLATDDRRLRRVGAGDQVPAEIKVIEGHIYVKAEKRPHQFAADMVAARLRAGATTKTFVQRLGEMSSDRAAPKSLLAFGLTIPFMGVNRAAAFLCTGFGGHMRRLGPLAVSRTVTEAARQGIVISDPRVLEIAGLINTLIIDAALLEDDTAKGRAKEAIAQLRRRQWIVEKLLPHKFAVYLMASGDSQTAARLAAEIGADDYFCASLAQERAEVIERLQKGMRAVCYVGREGEDALLLDKALAPVAVGLPSTGEEASAPINILDKDLRHLVDLFEMAARFGNKQRFNLTAPIILDVVDITTTIFIHFGLVYSTMFNYGSLLLGIANSRRPALPRRKPRQQRKKQDQRTPQLLTDL